jgi:hypothetical protein
MEHDCGSIWLHFIADAMRGNVDHSELRQGFRFQCRFRSILPRKGYPVAAQSPVCFIDFLLAKLERLNISATNISDTTAARDGVTLAYAAECDPEERFRSSGFRFLSQCRPNIAEGAM